MSPSEEFTCSLGVDPSIKINYKPINKYREHSGIISKVHVMTYRQQIEVKNTRQAPCKILVSDQLPQSTLDKIKVSRGHVKVVYVTFCLPIVITTRCKDCYNDAMLPVTCLTCVVCYR